MEPSQVLEPCDGKLSCTVLKGEWGCKAPDLLDADRELKFAWPSAIRLSGCEMSQLSLTGAARAPPIKLNRADPLRASLRSVGRHGKLHKKNQCNFRPQPTAAHLAARYVY